MVEEPGNEKNGVRTDTERVVSTEFSIEEGIPRGAVSGPEVVPDEMAASDHEGEKSESVKATEEAHAEDTTCSGPEEDSGTEALGVNNNPTREDLAVEMNEVNEQPVSHEERTFFEVNGTDEDEPPRQQLESPKRQNSPTQEEEVEDNAEEKETSTAPPADKEDINYEEYASLLLELCNERDKTCQHSSQLQAKLADYFRKKAGEDSQLERELPVSEQLQEYERHISILADLKRQLTTDSLSAQQQAEELSLQSQEKLEKVENEWRAFLALKQDVAVATLSRRLNKQVAQAEVESTLAREQLRQDQLMKLRLKYIKMQIKIHRLEAELRDGEEHARDPLQLRFEQLQAERLELKKQAEKQNEESLKILKKISSSLELLSNIKEKLFWSHMEVQAKREQLAEVEAVVARKRDLLTRTKKARNSLQRDNLKLKEQRGLLGNRVLLQDFEDTVDASDHLEERLENLKGRQAEIAFGCGRWRKRLETN